MAKRDKVSISKNAQEQLKERTDDLIDSGEFAIDEDFMDEVNEINAEQVSKGKFSSDARKRLENYLDDARLRRELSDDFDF